MKNEAWRRWAGSLKHNACALYLASKDPRVPILAKILIGIVVAYAVSPIDLIPDFIPVIGYLDDLILLPLGIWLAIRLIPRSVWEECQVLAKEQAFHVPRSRRAGIVVIIIWVLVLAGSLFWLWRQVCGVKGT